MTNKNALEVLNKLGDSSNLPDDERNRLEMIIRTALLQPVNKMMLDALKAIVFEMEQGDENVRVGSPLFHDAVIGIKAASSAPVVEVDGLEEAIDLESECLYMTPEEANAHGIVLEAARLQLARQKGGE